MKPFDTPNKKCHVYKDVIVMVRFFRCRKTRKPTNCCRKKSFPLSIFFSKIYSK